jgi:hypothetical protein
VNKGIVDAPLKKSVPKEAIKISSAVLKKANEI